MKENIENIDVLIVAYLTNDITDDQLQILNQWRDSNIQNQDKFEQFKSAWEKSKSLQVFYQVDVKQDWQSLKRKLSSNKPVVRKLKSTSKLVRRIAAIAIPAVLLISSGLLYWNVPGFGRLTSFETRNHVETIKLSDSSLVVLNLNSKIIYPKNMDSDSQRNVKLTGEAYFEVTHNNTPFIVSAGEAKVQVLGTRFNVNQHNTDLHVFVFSGKVSVEVNNDKVELTKNEQAILSNGQLVEKDLLETDNFYWQTKELKFNQANLQEICNKLKVTFHEIKNVKINTNDLETKVTTTFKGQSLKEIIEELQIHFDKKIVFDGSTLTISD